MAVADNAYSRFVRLAKVGLPLLALILLSTLFLFSRTLDPSAAIPFADIDVEKIAREQRLASPKFSGVTSDGSTVSVQAKSARPDPEDSRKLAASDVTADIATTSGQRYQVVANSAFFDGGADRLDLKGAVTITTSTGYELTSDELQTNLETTGLLSPGPVQGNGPAGRLNAGQMELTTTDGTQLLVFKNGVKLIYDPQP